MQPKNKLPVPTGVSSSKEIIWNGPAITCLEICTGDSLTTVVAAIAEKVCSINSSLDLSSVSLSCLIDQTPPDNKSLKTILELILENQCGLKTLINNITTSNGNVELNLNMRCEALKKRDAFNNELDQDLNQTLQSIIDEVCSLGTKVANLQGTVVSLQDQIDNLPTPESYTEPSFTLCTTGTTKKLSDAVKAIDGALCDYKTLVGSDVEINAVLAQQCPGIDDFLKSVPGWDSSPENLANSLANLWIAYCNLLTRVSAIETTCCGPTCDKIKLGFTVVFNDDGTVDFNFTSGAGTYIPSSFVDCGSVITLTDKNGVSLTLTGTTISQNGIIEDINISTLAKGLIKVNIKTKFCLKDSSGKTITVCQDCVALQFINTNGCCVITNASDASQTIVYKITSTI